MPIFRNVTCPVCGTLCDDLEVTVKDNTVVDVKNACAVGEAKNLFLKYRKLRESSVHSLNNLLIISVEIINPPFQPGNIIDKRKFDHFFNAYTFTMPFHHPIVESHDSI